MITIIYSTHKDFEYNSNFQKHLMLTDEVKDVIVNNFFEKHFQV
jgi:hypothetical protein